MVPLIRRLPQRLLQGRVARFSNQIQGQLVKDYRRHAAQLLQLGQAAQACWDGAAELVAVENAACTQPGALQ
jgi:hypothetical protein